MVYIIYSVFLYAMMDQKLGRGLSAIFGENGSTTKSELPVTFVDVESIIVNSDQPRKHFDEDKLRELSESIAKHGILQPLTVRKNGDLYDLLAGERRLRAAKMAGLDKVPVYILECTDKDVLMISLLENIQRDDLNPIEEAIAFKNLIQDYKCTQEELSEIVCKSRSYISNSMRMLLLPEVVQKMVQDGKLSAGHAKLLINLENAEEYAEIAVKNNMSVRALEKYIQDINAKSGTPIERSIDPDQEVLENDISIALGLKTKLKITKNGGIVSIYCKNCEELERLTKRLTEIEKIAG